MEITLEKTSAQPKTVLVRRDGVRYELRAVDRKFVPPHDIVHVIVENGLGIKGGFIGSIDQGALFDSMRHISGRRPPHPEHKSNEIIKKNQQDIRASEVAAGAFQEALLKFENLPFQTLQERTKHFPQIDLSSEVASKTWSELKSIGSMWEDLATGEKLVLHWPYRGAHT